MCVCLYVCQCVGTLVAEQTDVLSQNLVQGLSLMTSRGSSKSRNMCASTNRLGTWEVQQHLSFFVKMKFAGYLYFQKFEKIPC